VCACLHLHSVIVVCNDCCDDVTLNVLFNVCVLFLDDALKYVTIIPMGSRVPEADMHAIVSLMQASCEQSSRFVYQNILAPEAQKLLQSIHKTVLPSTPATVAASTVVRYPTPVTSMPLTAARLLVARQPGCIVSPGQQMKIIIGSMDMLRSLSTRLQTEGQFEEEELADRSRSPSPPHPIFNGPVVRYNYLSVIIILFPVY